MSADKTKKTSQTASKGGKSKGAKKTAPKKDTQSVVTTHSPKGVELTTYTEVNRIYRQTLSQMRGTLVITSTFPGEGASTLAHVLALRSADSGQKTLLIDLNMRSAGITSAFGVERHKWNLAKRKTNEPLTDVIDPVEKVPNLHVLAAPHDDESVQFLRDVHAASQLFANLEHHYDHIVVDTTPLQAVNRYNADPLMLAAAATRTVLVLLAGQTAKDKVQNSVRAIEDAGANLEGILVNDARNPTLKEQLLRFAGDLEKLSSSLGKWLKTKINDAQWLS